METTQPQLILIDGSSYLYRAYHAMPSLTNSAGEPTGAIYGVINMLRRLIKDYQPEKIAMIFDAKGKTFRHDMYIDYKANRSEMPSELASQIKPLHCVIKALGIPLISKPGVEADDVIGTLARNAERENISTLISTSDKDLAQLVSSHITLINTMTDTMLTEESVKIKFGVPPEKIIDYLALIGDTSDNIPGIPKVGPKTAVKWLTEFGSLDNLIKNAEKITGKVGDNLRANLKQIPVSKSLATIRTDIPLEWNYKELTPTTADKENLKKLFKKLEFKTWLNELIESQPTEDKKTNYETILTNKQLDKWIKKLESANVFAIDTETTHIEPMRAKLVGISFATINGEAAYLPLAHITENTSTQLEFKSTLNKLKPLLEDTKLKKIGHHLKYDITILKRAGINLAGIFADTLIESALLDNSNRHDMNTLALKHLGISPIKFEEVAGKGAKQITFDKVDINTASIYAAEDADITLQLHEKFWPRLQDIEKLKKVFLEIEMPLIPVLTRMEQVGVKINPELLLKQTAFLEDRLDKIEQETFILTNEKFNLNSPKQLQKILFEKMQLPIISKTPKGQPSTAESVLQELSHEYELPKLIIEHRSLAKLVSTYTKKLPELINEATGRIHTSWHQLGAATGRLSSSEPNLQNIPVRTDAGRQIRSAFIAADNHLLISADYSQIELRIMAHMSEDTALLNAFAAGIDIHTATAAEILNTTTDKVTSDQRRSAKAINFGLIYGMSAFGLAKQLNVDRKTAQEYIDLYFARYPGVANYMEKTRSEAHENCFVETLWGRRLYLPEINSSQIMRKKAAERTAINAPLQGTAADIIKRAMISLDNDLQKNKLPAKIIMQVHDELVLEVADNYIQDVKKIVENHMVNAAKLKVPLEVSIGAGHNWDAASGK